MQSLPTKYQNTHHLLKIYIEQLLTKNLNPLMYFKPTRLYHFSKKKKKKFGECHKFFFFH